MWSKELNQATVARFTRAWIETYIHQSQNKPLEAGSISPTGS
jgi:hypothetical protein